MQVHRVVHQLPSPCFCGIGRALPDAVQRRFDERGQEGEGEEDEQGERPEGGNELAHAAHIA